MPVGFLECGGIFGKELERERVLKRSASVWRHHQLVLKGLTARLYTLYPIHPSRPTSPHFLKARCSDSPGPSTPPPKVGAISKTSDKSSSQGLRWRQRLSEVAISVAGGGRWNADVQGCGGKLLSRVSGRVVNPGGSRASLNAKRWWIDVDLGLVLVARVHPSLEGFSDDLRCVMRYGRRK